MAGRSSTLKSSAATTGTTTNSRRALCASTMFTVPWARTTAARKKLPRQSRAKSRWPKIGGEIEVWGDGEQTRSFMYVDDCVEGLIRLMASDHRDALNLGTDELVTINQLVDLVAKSPAKRIAKRHNLSGPQGVRGRNSDNTPAAQSAGLGAFDSLARRSGQDLSLDRLRTNQEVRRARGAGLLNRCRLTTHTEARVLLEVPA